MFSRELKIRIYADQVFMQLMHHAQEICSSDLSRSSLLGTRILPNHLIGQEQFPCWVSSKHALSNPTACFLQLFASSSPWVRTFIATIPTSTL